MKWTMPECWGEQMWVGSGLKSLTTIPEKINPPAWLIDPPTCFMKLPGRFFVSRVGFLALGLLLFLGYSVPKSLSNSKNLNKYQYLWQLSLAKFVSSSNLTFKEKSFGIKFINDNDPTHLENVIWIYSTLDIFPSKTKIKFKMEFKFRKSKSIEGMLIMETSILARSTVRVIFCEKNDI